MTSSVNFVVVVGDVNDNAPVFLNDTYTVDLPENDVIGKTVLKVVVIRGVRSWPFGKLPFNLTVKKLPKTFQKNCQKFKKKLKKLPMAIFLNFVLIFGNVFEKNVKFLAIFWQSNGNFPVGQLGTLTLSWATFSCLFSSSTSCAWTALLESRLSRSSNWALVSLYWLCERTIYSCFYILI